MTDATIQNDPAAAVSATAVLSRLGARSIVLVGMMGVGKSSIGRRLGARLGGPFVDSDSEIEQASGALRRAGPALEAWLPGAAAASEPRNPRPVWILVGTIWIATVLAVACAIASILYFLG